MQPNPNSNKPDFCDPDIPGDVEVYEISKEITQYEVLRASNQFHEANKLKKKIEDKLKCNPELAKKINFITNFPKK
jgi:hypothetical protein